MHDEYYEYDGILPSVVPLMRMPVFVKDVFLENADYTLMSFMTSFNFLGDWIPGPFGNIISMGDVLLALGCALMIPETRARQNR